MDIDQHSIHYQVPYDKRFPNTNQTKACWISFVNYLKAVNSVPIGGSLRGTRAGEERRKYTALCPNSMIEAWTEQVNNNVFPGFRWTEVSPFKRNVGTEITIVPLYPVPENWREVLHLEERIQKDSLRGDFPEDYLKERWTQLTKPEKGEL